MKDMHEILLQEEFILTVNKKWAIKKKQLVRMVLLKLNTKINVKYCVHNEDL